MSDMNRDRDITNVFIAKGVSRCVPGVRCVPGDTTIAIYKPDYRKLFTPMIGKEPGQIWGYFAFSGHGVKYYHGR